MVMTEASTTNATLREPAPPIVALVKDSDVEKLCFIELMTLNVDAMQEHVLSEILTHNANVEYLAMCGLSSATDRATFWGKVPIVSYEDLQPYA
jgi:hypothetical protein